ncbi:hypothetical protein LIER_42059 [Lithospermum erythrorhizon]|uniref:ATPase family AAA domain-containing protein n=1 Tax=Lithospermum erythrorhizon TaxID=34254 RepID=A0AAV3RNX1_LITER
MSPPNLSPLLAAASSIAAATTTTKISYCDGFRLPPFFSSTPSSESPTSQNESSSSSTNSNTNSDEDCKVGFDAGALERAAAALRKINSSQYAQQVFGIMRSQEQTRQAELSAEKAHFEAIQAHRDIVSGSVLTIIILLILMYGK